MSDLSTANEMVAELSSELFNECKKFQSLYNKIIANIYYKNDRNLTNNAYNDYIDNYEELVDLFDQIKSVFSYISDLYRKMCAATSNNGNSMDIDLLAEVDNMTGSVAQIRIMIGKQMSNILEIFSGITSMLNNRIGYIQHMQIGVSSIINDLHDIMQCDMSIQQKIYVIRYR